MKGAFLIGDGRGRTDGLDVESAIPYTEAVDEGAYKGNGARSLPITRKLVWCRKVLLQPIEQRLQHKLPRRWTNRYVVSTKGGALLSLIKQDSEQHKHG
jgi:hypothetical protein